ncbi:serine protease spb1 [Bdellovibrio bacteriovorus]|uniref:serine protease spb1 n=1 Tax=Bdellovibrio bacteriovorus TaxID=959 RepID=UPI0035A578D5
MFKKIIFAAGLVLSSGAASAEQSPECPLYFPDSELCASVEFAQAPNQNADSPFVLKVYDQTSTASAPALVDPAQLKVDLWMNMGHHGHGTSPVKIEKQEVGTFLISEAYFVMPGKWLIRVWINGEKSEMTVVVKP